MIWAFTDAPAELLAIGCGGLVAIRMVHAQAYFLQTVFDHHELRGQVFVELTINAGHGSLSYCKIGASSYQRIMWNGGLKSGPHSLTIAETVRCRSESWPLGRRS